MQVRYPVLLLGLLALFAGPTAAQEEEPKARDVRVYVGASGIASWQPSFEDEFSNATVDTDEDSGPGWGGAVTYGVRFMKELSVEVDFEYVRKYDFDQTSTLGTKSDEVITYALTSNVAYHPVDYWIDPFISVGAGWMRAELDDFDAAGDGLAFRFGAGVDVWMTDHIGLRMEGRYLLPVTNEVRDFDAYGPKIGLFYRF